MKYPHLLILPLLLLFVSPSVYALRCGHELVDLEDYQEDVLTKCGEPESANSHKEIRSSGNYAGGSRNLFYGNQHLPNSSVYYGNQQIIDIEVNVDEWVYDFGHRKFKQYLRFENGRLKEVKKLGRGD